MKAADRRFWPFGPRACVLCVAAILIGLLVIIAIMRRVTSWPGEKSETVVLVGVLLISLLPIVLVLLDALVEGGGTIEVRGVKVAFAQVREARMSGITVPVNIGVRGQSISDSDTTQILDTLRNAGSCDLVVIDLEEGQAWWETRLFVLLSGAERRGKPGKVVFVGTDAGKVKMFLGWAHPSELLPLLARAHPVYALALEASRTAARQWMLVEPAQPVVPNTPPPAPVLQPWMQGLSVRYQWMAFDGTTGERNESFAEQALASELGEKVEKQVGSRSISLVRLEELFRPVLSKEHIDQSWPDDRQVAAFLEGDAPFVALTENGRFSGMLSRLTVLTVMMKSFIEGKKA